MFGKLLQRLIGPIFGVIDKAVVDKDVARKLKFEIELAVLANQAEFTKAARDIVVAEATGGALQRNWRPGDYAFLCGDPGQQFRRCALCGSLWRCRRCIGNSTGDVGAPDHWHGRLCGRPHGRKRSAESGARNRRRLLTVQLEISDVPQ